MVSSSVARLHPADSAMETVYIRMDATEVSSLLRKTTRYLKTHLSLGSFEGPTGAQKPIVMRLSLACDLLLVALNVRLKDSDSLALADLELRYLRASSSDRSIKQSSTTSYLGSSSMPEEQPKNRHPVASATSRARLQPPQRSRGSQIWWKPIFCGLVASTKTKLQLRLPSAPSFES